MDILTYKKLDRLDEIRLNQFRVPCIIGIYEQEWHTPQPLEIELTLHLDSRRAARSCNLEHTVDYESLAEEVGFILKHSHFGLLETAADALAHYILKRSGLTGQQLIQRVDIRLVKPNALSIAVPSLRISRSLEEIQEVEESGIIKNLYQAENYSISAIKIKPQSSVSLQEIELHRSDVYFPLTEDLFLNKNKWLRSNILETSEKKQNSIIYHHGNCLKYANIIGICRQKKNHIK